MKVILKPPSLPSIQRCAERSLWLGHLVLTDATTELGQHLRASATSLCSWVQGQVAESG